MSDWVGVSKKLTSILIKEKLSKAEVTEILKNDLNYKTNESENMGHF